MLPYDQQNIAAAVQQLAQATPGVMKIPTDAFFDPQTQSHVQNYEVYSIRALRAAKNSQKWLTMFSDQSLQEATEIWMVPGNTPLPPVPRTIIDISTSVSLATGRFLTVDNDGETFFTDTNNEMWVRLVDGTPFSQVRDLDGKALPASTFKQGYMVKLGLVLADPSHAPAGQQVFFEKVYSPGNQPIWQMVTSVNQPPLSYPPNTLWTVIEVYRGPGLQTPAYYYLAVKS